MKTGERPDRLSLKEIMGNVSSAVSPLHKLTIRSLKRKLNAIRESLRSEIRNDSLEASVLPVTIKDMGKSGHGTLSWNSLTSSIM